MALEWRESYLVRLRLPSPTLRRGVAMDRDQILPEPSPGDTTVAFGSFAAGEMEPADPSGLSAVALAAIEALPPTSALLVVQRGPNSGSRFLLDADCTSAGRSTRSDIFLDDVTVSRRHAEFVREGQEFYVRDKDSLNGTYVNRERVEDAVLHAGDEVQIGKYRLTFHPSPAKDSEASEGE
jgi:pSer/pThr/pTyr-binding forkhead associated (FHA) protein